MIFGAGDLGITALRFLGNKRVSHFIDNDKKKQGKTLEGKPIISIDEYIENDIKDKIVISVSEKYVGEIITQLEKNGVNNFATFSEVAYEETKKKLLNRVDYINIYYKAIGWVIKNTNNGEGVICNSKFKKSYPEVTGYYIPTLLRWGYKELAIQYAKWLCQIQHEDGAWYDTQGENPYIFDSAQILKGLIAIREYIPEVDTSIEKGCDWILSNMTSEGRLVSPLENPWGDGKTYSELIHTYCISPIKEAGKLLNREDYVKKADLIVDYYTTKCRDKILNFDLLSHFYAYVMEAMIDIGHEELAREAMDKIATIQKESGAVPGYNNVDWVCSTGLFQLALVWFRLGDLERGHKAFGYACKLQNETGGWYGSYISEDNANEINTYFPDAEISWANKYFLDALYYKNFATFEQQSSIFGQSISDSDGRYKCIEELVKSLDKENPNASVLDVGCGKGRYLKNLVSKYPDMKYYAVDLSVKVMEYFEDIEIVEKKQGTLTSIPFEDNRFEVTYTCEALEHAVDIKNAIKEMCRVTKSGGTIAIIDKNKEKLGYLEIDEFEQWFSEEELKKELLDYCSEVRVNTDISFDDQPANGLFYCWIARKK